MVTHDINQDITQHYKGNLKSKTENTKSIEEHINTVCSILYTYTVYISTYTYMYTYTRTIHTYSIQDMDINTNTYKHTYVYIHKYLH